MVRTLVSLQSGVDVNLYLLVKQSPEHWQGDVEHQNPQNHLDLLNQSLLLNRGAETRMDWCSSEGLSEFPPAASGLFFPVKKQR